MDFPFGQLGGAGPTVDTDKDYLDTQGEAVKARMAKTVQAHSDMDTLSSTTTQVCIVIDWLKSSIRLSCVVLVLCSLI